MIESRSRYRSRLLWVTLLAVAIGILSRMIRIGEPIWDKYVGDVVYAAVFYLALSLLWSEGAVTAKALLTAVYVVAVETFQLTPVPARLNQSANPAVRAFAYVVLGSVFGWWDMVAYLIGIGGISLADKLFLRRAEPSRPRHPHVRPSSLPASPAQITPAFLTHRLRAAGVLRQAAVTAIQLEPIAAKAGFNAQLARLRLSYSAHEAQAPHSIIAKLPTVQAALHQHAAVFRPGTKECWFYRHGAARTPVCVPRCYYGAVDAAAGESFLLLQDLAPARTVDWVDGASPAETDLALQTLARLHAAWWDVDPASDRELARLVDPSGAEQDLVERLYRQAWPRFLASAEFEIGDDVRQLGERLVGHIAAAEALLDGSPRTLVHGDFRLGNLLFGTHRGVPACWVIDWEDILLWNGMLDVAWFLGGCLPLQASDREKGLVRRYHRALTREGVNGYAWAQCYHDYRCAMLSCFVQGILSAVPPGTGDAYDRALARVLGERFTAASRRLRLDELLPV